MSNPQENKPKNEEKTDIALPAPLSDVFSQKPDAPHILQIQATLLAQSLGPFPHPDMLARFEQIVPGSAAKIIKMAESQTSHRQSLEKAVVLADVQKSWYGLLCGLIIGMTGIIGTVVLGIFGQPVLGGVLGSSTLVSLVSVFVIGRKKMEAERMEKAKIMTEAQEKPPAASSPPAT
jgi:uncharacterized membrane protein